MAAIATDNGAHTQAALSSLRTILAVAGGFAVGRGWITTEQSAEIIGVLVALVPLVWGVWNSYTTEAKAQVREADALVVGAVATRAGIIPVPEAVTPTQAKTILAAAKEEKL